MRVLVLGLYFFSMPLWATQQSVQAEVSENYSTLLEEAVNANQFPKFETPVSKEKTAYVGQCGIIEEPNSIFHGAFINEMELNQKIGAQFHAMNFSVSNFSGELHDKDIQSLINTARSEARLHYAGPKVDKSAISKSTTENALSNSATEFEGKFGHLVTDVPDDYVRSSWTQYFVQNKKGVIYAYEVANSPMDLPISPELVDSIEFSKDSVREVIDSLGRSQTVYNVQPGDITSICRFNRVLETLY